MVSNRAAAEPDQPGQALFNIDLSDETDAAGQAVATVNRLLSEYLYAPLPPLSIPTLRSRRLQAAHRTLDQVVHEIITRRRQQNSDTGDLLSMLLLYQILMITIHSADATGLRSQFAIT